ncbi:thioredoxin family protein [Oscillatoria salina]|uniref:thioredoxin family protein n=1 Tax=Oscillatoria salina TaxID=331517 RepID=UPI0013BD1B61|nr:thioredoxin family protein [Oscillatoria salina]MBZ8180624.1 thioredoxin family protein [Oscillatoria salina IIICB1]NET88434.1 thioredoxin family protein [Kamptonema sp. SIO1D9]
MVVEQKNDPTVGQYAPDFELPGIDGQVHHLSRYLEKFRVVAVIFICNHCPYVRLYLDRLKEIQDRFESEGFTAIGINANDTDKYPEDSFEKMKSFAMEKKLNFPYLWDPSQDVANCFDARVTPEVFLIDNAGVVRYRGKIDDRPEDPEAVQNHYLRDNIVALLSSEQVTTSITEAIGCTIKWREDKN